MAIVNALQLEPTDVAPVVLGCFSPNLYFTIANAHKLLFSASDQNSDIAIRFSDPDFLKERNNLATRWRFHAATLTIDQMTLTIDQLTLFVVHRMSHVQTMYQFWAQLNTPRPTYWWLSNFVKGRGGLPESTLQRGWTKLHKIWGEQAPLLLHQRRYFRTDMLRRFEIRVAKTMVWKSRTFWPPSKIMGGVGEVAKFEFTVRPNIFDGWPLGGLED